MGGESVDAPAYEDPRLKKLLAASIAEARLKPEDVRVGLPADGYKTVEKFEPKTVEILHFEATALRDDSRYKVLTRAHDSSVNRRKAMPK